MPAHGIRKQKGDYPEDQTNERGVSLPLDFLRLRRPFWSIFHAFYNDPKEGVDFTGRANLMNTGREGIGA